MRIPTALIALSCLVQQAWMTTASKADDFKVNGLEEVAPAFAEFQKEGDMYAGLLPIDIQPNESRGELMFWYFEPHNPIAPDTLTIFINGGPGCSTVAAGVLFECAPVTTPHHPAGYPNVDARSDEPLEYNKWGWTKATNMLFVDQPAGVGFTSGPVVQTEDDVAFDFYNFLVNFYETFPHLQEKRLFFFGESYAGYYVPSIARKIYHENQKGLNTHINLEAIGIGNGWMEAKTQTPYMVDYAWYHGLIDSTTREGLLEIYKECLEGVEMEEPFHEFNIPHECNLMDATLAAAGAGIIPGHAPNIYDYTTWDTYPILLDDNSTIIRFLNDPAVKKGLNIPEERTFETCLPGGGRRRTAERMVTDNVILVNDQPETTVPYVAELLDDAGIRVLMYNGDRDVSCNSAGTEALLDSMSWSGSDEWKTAQRGLWMVDNQPSGYIKSHGKLDFLVVRNSGHLVPTNVPQQALDMVTRYVTDQSFNDANLPSFHKLKTKMTKKPELSPTSTSQSDGHVGYVILGCFLLVGIATSFSAGYFAARRPRRKRGHGYTSIDNDGIELEP